jgi:4-oxalocrotonate tautomerase
MPLVRISVPTHFSAERQRGLAEAVHAAMVATINIPAADRFQIISRHAPDDLVIDPDFLDISRSKDAVIVQITFRAGRSNDQKRALYARITDLAAQSANLRAQDIMIVLTENSLPDWSFGAGKAQYALTG